MRTHVSRVTLKDCRVETFKVSGAGGQRRDKTDSGVRITHPPSGAVGRSVEHRTQRKNKQLALRRMAESPEFMRWAAIQSGLDVQRRAEVANLPAGDFKVEVRRNGVWVEQP